MFLSSSHKERSLFAHPTHDFEEVSSRPTPLPPLDRHLDAFGSPNTHIPVLRITEGHSNQDLSYTPKPILSSIFSVTGDHSK